MWVILAIRMSMRTVQMTLNEDLVEAVDRAARELRTTRSAFARQALQNALRALQISKMEEKQRQGYSRKPVEPGEFSDWEDEQVWTQ
jgi:metal-responsive CopG/Arc/MetJ family transcriptional regulator